MKILVTGSCGFIGYHLSLSLLKNKNIVYGIDTLNDYYDISLKKERLEILRKKKNFKFYKIDISNKKKIDAFFNKHQLDIVVNLAAYAGVQYSLRNPDIYFKTNEIGFYNILENARKHKIKKIIFASSSSVAGNNRESYFSESDKTDSPISLYAATKKNNEILAHFYAVNYKIMVIGVRFFTVYGPYGRPDLSIFKFAHFINQQKNFILNNNGNHFRDFTYIDDVIKCLKKLISIKKFHKLDRKINPFFQIFNLGGGNKIKITLIVKILEKLIGKKAKIKFGPLKKGDIIFSRSHTRKLIRNIKYFPDTSISKGLKFFYKWFNEKNF